MAAVPGFPPDARLAILVGDPAKRGPYVIRVKLPAGTKMMPHRHPKDRIYTVLSGVFYIGLGDIFDESKLAAYASGRFVAITAIMKRPCFAQPLELASLSILTV